MFINIKENLRKTVDKNELEENVEWKLEYKALVDKNSRLQKRIKKFKLKLILRGFFPKSLLKFFKEQLDDYQDIKESLNDFKQIYIVLLGIKLELLKKTVILKSIKTTGDEGLNYHKNICMAKYSKQKKLVDHQLLKTLKNLNKIEKIFIFVNKKEMLARPSSEEVLMKNEE